MGQKYSTLLEKTNELHDIEKAGALMIWDREVNMPPKGSSIRTQQLSTIQKLIHTMSTSDEMGEMIERAEEEVKAEDHPYGSTEASLVRFLKRNYAEAKRFPLDYVIRSAQISGDAIPAWKEARENKDFTIFSPHLTKMVELIHEQAEIVGYEDEKYDAMIDQYERGLKTADVRRVFDAVKAETVPLIQAIADKGNVVDDSFLHQPYPIAQQKAVAPYFAEAVGYNFDKGHIGTAAHPFALSLSRDDSRITTRWHENFLNPFLFGTMHECGHAMYEQGTGEELQRTPLAQGTSMGVHESQSRLFENLVGRSFGFWRTHYYKLKESFPEQLGDISVEQFYRGINKIQPSFIRVEADELTYNMHIILRFELEQAMLNGEVKIDELPTAWNDKMVELLGIIPEDDAAGCLQDIHWTRPTFGYFPTYALGNLYASQLMAAATNQNPAIVTELENGQVNALRSWLHENIHRHGSKYDSAELINRATGETLNHEPFVAYARDKFTTIYDL